MQMTAYCRAILDFKNNSKWFAFIDLDEFIIPIETETISQFSNKLPSKAVQLIIGGVFTVQADI